MIYESKLYIVDKHDWEWSDKKWGEIIAMFDLHQVPISSDCRKYPATDCYIILNSERVIEDSYGKPLNEIPIKDMINIIENEILNEEYYRRYQPCLSLLKGFNLDDWGNLVVLHYGY